MIYARYTSFAERLALVTNEKTFSNMEVREKNSVAKTA